MDEFAQLPGGDLVLKGLEDLRGSHVTEESLLVAIAAPSLRSLGISVPQIQEVERPYEHALYSMLELRLGRGAHAAYNALIQRVVSFANAYAVSQKADDVPT